MALSMDDGNWVPIFAKIRDSWLWKDAEVLRGFIDLLIIQQKKEGVMPHFGDFLPLEPGQVATTYQALAKRWGMARSRVQRALKRLADDRTVTLKRARRGRKPGTWVSTTSDRSILILTLVNSPVRHAWLRKRAQERAHERADDEAKTSTEKSVTVHEPSSNSSSIREVVEVREKEGNPRASKSTGQRASTRVEGTAPPVLPPAGGAPEESGEDQAIARCLQASSAFASPGRDVQEREFWDLRRQGVTVERIEAAFQANPKADFYAVLKPLRNVKIHTPFVPALTPKPQEAAKSGPTQAARAQAFELAKRKLDELSAEAREAWRRDAEAAADQQKIVVGYLRDQFIETELRLRCGKEFGIEGL